MTQDEEKFTPKQRRIIAILFVITLAVIILAVWRECSPKQSDKIEATKTQTKADISTKSKNTSDIADTLKKVPVSADNNVSGNARDVKVYENRPKIAVDTEYTKKVEYLKEGYGK